MKFLAIDRLYFGAYCILRSSALFSLPGLRALRNFVYSRYFKTTKMRVGDFVLIACAHPGGNRGISIGSSVDVGRGSYIDYSGGVVIGSGVAISDGAKIYTHNHDVRKGYTDWTKNPITFSSIVIEDHVWIGANAIVLAGVERIGRGAVVAAGAVVTSQVGEQEIVAGIPARPIAHRNSVDSNLT